MLIIFKAPSVVWVFVGELLESVVREPFIVGIVLIDKPAVGQSRKFFQLP